MVPLAAKENPMPNHIPRLKVSDNRRFLQYDNGEPFFYLGDTAWELFHRLDREEVELYLTTRAAQGFTSIQAVLLAEMKGIEVPNVYGHTPLIDNDPTKLREGYFQFVDWVVEQAAARGLFMALLPTWGDTINSRPWGSNPKIFTPENARIYGRLLGSRYKGKPIIWVLGGDRPVDTSAERAIWDAMAAGIREGSGGDQLITYHPFGEHSSSQFVHDAPWLDFNMLQSGHGRSAGASWQMITRDYAMTPAKPTLDGEPNYEEHPINWRPENGYFSDYEVRRSAYWSVFSGACGVTYGCQAIWQFYDYHRDAIAWPKRSWQESLCLPGAWQMRHLKDLILSRPYFTRFPDPSIFLSNDSGPDHMVATRDGTPGKNNATCLMIYCPISQSSQIDTSAIASKRLARSWFDPRTGRFTKADELENTSRCNIPSPASGKDFVLVIDQLC
jgi:Protein of unknown function (DUF4038)/Putative collagen-binding domain of a collagenase